MASKRNAVDETIDAYYSSLLDSTMEAGDNQQRHAVAREVETLPSGPRRQQHTARAGPELLGSMDSAAAHGEQGITQAVVRQALLHRRRGGVGRKQRQGVALGCVQQGGDLLRQLVIVGCVLLTGQITPRNAVNWSISPLLKQPTPGLMNCGTPPTTAWLWNPARTDSLPPA